MEVQRTKHQIKLEEWTHIIRECRNSGVTVTSWCEAQGIKKQTYYRWQKIVWDSGMKEKALIPVKNNEIAFAEYTHPQGSVSSAQSAAIVLHIGEIRLEIQNGADQVTIENTLKVLRSLC